MYHSSNANKLIPVLLWGPYCDSPYILNLPSLKILIKPALYYIKESFVQN